jgi:methylated-DNA-[protein]-cysteine S-methyltransferase
MNDRNILLAKVKNTPGLTPFQKKVLRAVVDIPRGKTRSYAWVALRAGSPGACRAVGQALKRNPYAPHVPCHRVVAADGSIGGYSGGIEKKMRLLSAEGVRI